MVPYRVWMKMTMPIDEVLLERVMERHGLETKTDAVNFALKELDRRSRLREVLEAGMSMTSDELKDSVYEGYDLGGLRAAEAPARPYGFRKKDTDR